MSILKITIPRALKVHNCLLSKEDKKKEGDVAEILFPEVSAGYARRKFSGIKNGNIKFDVDFITSLCEILGVDSNFIFGIKEGIQINNNN
jgi:hypothetical protein